MSVLMFTNICFFNFPSNIPIKTGGTSKISEVMLDKFGCIKENIAILLTQNDNSKAICGDITLNDIFRSTFGSDKYMRPHRKYGKNIRKKTINGNFKAI